MEDTSTKYLAAKKTAFTKVASGDGYFHSLYKLLLFIFCMNLFAGCASLSTQIQQQNQTSSIDTSVLNIQQNRLTTPETENGWWQIAFHRPYTSDDEIQWQYDAFIALKVLKPIIDSEKSIQLWRFHRRAADDKSGHNFSFIFYATRKVGEAVYQQVSQHVAVKKLLNNHYIEGLNFYNINEELRSDIGATSDKNWPVELQKTWPYFIMGVSQTWLGLVEYYYNQLEIEDNMDVETQLNRFKQVSASIDDLWKNTGAHAFLHHLNALFAYQELYIIERRLTRF